MTKQPVKKNPKEKTRAKPAARKSTTKTTTPQTPNKQRSDPKMLGVLVCPKTRGPLVFDPDRNELVSKKAKLAFPIRDGVPVLLESEARRLDK